MLYKICELIITYGILLIGFKIMKFSDLCVSKEKTNILSVCIKLVGMIIIGYSFLKIGKESSIYMKNIFKQHLLNQRDLDKICVPIIILSIIGGVLLKLSDLYENKGRKNICSIIVACGGLSVFGSLSMLLTTILCCLNIL
ncbi:hypothetical protein [Clostridium botulinum]|uniref:hypothetical protein n=1 Tax=Clostridium botulinum TaxID=1491 RepID=UPI0013C91604|nr:hypothetical protein [Clostridium botulinum]